MVTTSIGNFVVLIAVSLMVASVSSYTCNGDSISAAVTIAAEAEAVSIVGCHFKTAVRITMAAVASPATSTGGIVIKDSIFDHQLALSNFVGGSSGAPFILENVHLREGGTGKVMYLTNFKIQSGGEATLKNVSSPQGFLLTSFAATDAIINIQQVTARSFEIMGTNNFLSGQSRLNVESSTITNKFANYFYSNRNEYFSYVSDESEVFFANTHILDLELHLQRNGSVIFGSSVRVDRHFFIKGSSNSFEDINTTISIVDPSTLLIGDPYAAEDFGTSSLKLQQLVIADGARWAFLNFRGINVQLIMVSVKDNSEIHFAGRVLARYIRLDHVPVTRNSAIVLNNVSFLTHSNEDSLSLAGSYTRFSENSTLSIDGCDFTSDARLDFAIFAPGAWMNSGSTLMIANVFFTDRVEMPAAGSISNSTFSTENVTFGHDIELFFANDAVVIWGDQTFAQRSLKLGTSISQGATIIMPSVLSNDTVSTSSVLLGGTSTTLEQFLFNSTFTLGDNSAASFTCYRCVFSTGAIFVQRNSAAMGAVSFNLGTITGSQLFFNNITFNVASNADCVRFVTNPIADSELLFEVLTMSSCRKSFEIVSDEVVATNSIFHLKHVISGKEFTTTTVTSGSRWHIGKFISSSFVLEDVIFSNIVTQMKGTSHLRMIGANVTNLINVECNSAFFYIDAGSRIPQTTKIHGCVVDELAAFNDSWPHSSTPSESFVKTFDPAGLRVLRGAQLKFSHMRFDYLHLNGLVMDAGSYFSIESTTVDEALNHEHAFRISHGSVSEVQLCITNSYFGGRKYGFAVWHDDYKVLIANSTMTIANSTFHGGFANKIAYVRKTRGYTGHSPYFNTTVVIENSVLHNTNPEWNNFILDSHSHLILGPNVRANTLYVRGCGYNNPTCSVFFDNTTVVGEAGGNVFLENLHFNASNSVGSNSLAPAPHLTINGGKCHDVYLLRVHLHDGARLILRNFDVTHMKLFYGVATNRSQLLIENATIINTVKQTGIHVEYSSLSNSSLVVANSTIFVFNEHRLSAYNTYAIHFRGAVTTVAEKDSLVLLENCEISGEVTTYYRSTKNQITYGKFSDSLLLLVGTTMIGRESTFRFDATGTSRLVLVNSINNGTLLAYGNGGPAISIGDGSFIAIKRTTVVGFHFRQGDTLLVGGSPPSSSSSASHLAFSGDISIVSSVFFNGSSLVLLNSTSLIKTVDIRDCQFLDGSVLVVAGGEYAAGLQLSTGAINGSTHCYEDVVLQRAPSSGRYMSLLYYNIAVLTRTTISIRNATMGTFYTVYRDTGNPYTLRVSGLSKSTIILQDTNITDKDDLVPAAAVRTFGETQFLYGPGNVAPDYLEMTGLATDTIDFVSPMVYNETTSKFVGIQKRTDAISQSDVASVYDQSCGAVLQRARTMFPSSFGVQSGGVPPLGRDSLSDEDRTTVDEMMDVDQTASVAYEKLTLETTQKLFAECASDPQPQNDKEVTKTRTVPTSTPSVSLRRTASRSTTSTATVSLQHPTTNEPNVTVPSAAGPTSNSPIPSASTAPSTQGAEGPTATDVSTPPNTTATPTPIPSDTASANNSSNGTTTVGTATRNTKRDSRVSLMVSKAFGDEEVGTAVAASSVSAMVASSALSPTAASQLSRVAASVHAINCFLDEDGDMKPSHFELPLQPPIGSSSLRYHAGGVLTSSLLIALSSVVGFIAIRLRAQRNWKREETHRRRYTSSQPSNTTESALVVAGTAASVFLLYLTPNVVASVVLIFVHGSAVEDAVAMMSLGLVINVVVFITVQLTSWFSAVTSPPSANVVTDEATATTSSEEEEEESDSTSSSSSNNTGTTSDSIERASRKMEFCDEKRGSFFVLAYQSLFDGTSEPIRLVQRLYTLEELGSSCLMAGIAGARPGRGHCTTVTSSLLVIAVAHLGYVAYFRPMRTRLDHGFSLFFACVQVLMGIACVAAAKAIESDDENGSTGAAPDTALTVVSYTVLVMFAGFFVQVFVQGYWAYHTFARRRNEALMSSKSDSSSSDDDDDGGDDRNDREMLEVPLIQTITTTSSAEDSIVKHSPPNAKKDNETSHHQSNPLAEDIATS